MMPSYLFLNIHSHKEAAAAKMRDHFCGSSPDFKSFIGLICTYYNLRQPNLAALLPIYELTVIWANQFRVILLTCYVFVIV